MKTQKKDAAVKSIGVIDHTFSRPVEFESEKYEKFEINLDALTGRDLSIAKSEWALAGKFSPMPATDQDYCATVACNAAKMPREFADYWPAPDYTAICQKVSNFLLS